MPLGTEVNLGPGDFVLGGIASSSQKGHSPQFSAHFHCGQTAGWMKTPLGTEVDLGPDQTQLAPAKGAHPLFRLMSIVITVAHLSYY